MGFIVDALPIAAPREAKLFTEDGNRLIKRGIIKVFGSLKNADVEGNSKIVVGVPALSVGYVFVVGSANRPQASSFACGIDFCEVGPSPEVNGVLLRVCSCSRYHLDRDAGIRGSVEK